MAAGFVPSQQLPLPITFCPFLRRKQKIGPIWPAVPSRTSSNQPTNNFAGRIINVSSVAGLYGYPGLSVYCASKHALEGFSRAMRQEMAKFGVSVITVQPGDFSKATRLLDNHHR